MSGLNGPDAKTTLTREKPSLRRKRSGMLENLLLWRAARQCGGDLIGAVPVSRANESGSNSQARPPSLQQTVDRTTRA